MSARPSTSLAPRGSLKSLPFGLALGSGFLLVAILWHALARVPIAFGDQYEEIVRVYNTSLVDLLSQYIHNIGTFFRPLEYVWRYLIAHGLEQGVWGYNLFQGLLLAATAALFTLLCRPTTWRDLNAILPALCILFGHAAMHGTWELNIVFSNGLVLTLMIVSLLVIRGRGGIVSQIVMILAAATSLLTKEVGLVVAGVFVLAHLLGMGGARRWTALVVSLMVVAYLGFRLGGDGDLVEITPGKAHEISSYLANISATFVMFWIGGPTDGEWVRFLGSFRPGWPALQVVAGLSLAAVLVAAWRVSERDRSDSPTDAAPPLDRRWFVLFGAALLASCVLGFYYTRHRHGAPALPLLAYCAYLSIRLLLDRLAADTNSGVGRLPRWMGIALLACGLFWPMRVVTGFQFTRDLSGAIHASWREDMSAFWNRVDPDQRPPLKEFADSVDQMPEPVLRVPILRYFGNRQSVSR